MRKILATSILILSTAGAMAADLPMRTAPVFAPPPLPFFTWTGGYFGINAGYAFDYSSRFNTANGSASEFGLGGVPTVRPGAARVTSDGFTAGGQIGYNYQFGAGNGVVVGFEADAAYTDLGQTNGYLTGGAGNPLTTLHTDMDFLGTVRGRLGYAFDRFLVFGTGGFAYGDVNQRSNFYLGSTTASSLIYSGGRSNIQTGYAYGGGIEYAVPTESFLSTLNFFHSSAMTIKAEYLHYDLGSTSLAVPATGAVLGATGIYSQRIKTDGDLARIGINYKF